MGLEVFPVMDEFGSITAEAVEVIHGFEESDSTPFRVDHFKMISRFGSVKVSIRGLRSDDPQVISIFSSLPSGVPYFPSSFSPLLNLTVFLLHWILAVFYLGFTDPNSISTSFPEV